MQTTTISNESPQESPQPIQIKSNEQFYNRSLEALRENEMNIKQYWSKPVLVTIPKLHTSGQVGEARIRGKFGYCDDGGWVGFNDVIFEKHPESQFLEGIFSTYELHAPCIDDIILIEEEDTYDEKQEKTKSDNYNTHNKTSYRLGKSIKNIIFDVIRLKLVHKSLFNLTPKWPDLKPLNLYNRQLYFRKSFMGLSMKEEMKKLIGDKIINMKKIPEHLNVDPLFTTNLTGAMLDTEKIRVGLGQHTLNDLLSLLRDYHDLWIQHIQKNNEKMDAAKDQKDDELKAQMEDVIKPFDKSYISWDEYELIKDPVVQYPPVSHAYCVENSEDIFAPPVYKNTDALKHPFAVTIVTKRKVENIYVEYIWPYYFKGPFSKLKKNNPDWLCMKCLKESKVFGFVPFAGNDDCNDNIYFYKANRTDMTMEVCDPCINMCLYQKGLKKATQKQVKATKRYQKRLKKKLAEYAEKEIPWTPPSILAGMKYYGIPSRPLIGRPVYLLPYPNVPSYMPGMNPPMNYAPPMTKPGGLGPYSRPAYMPTTYTITTTILPYPPKSGPVGATYSLPYPMLPSYMPGMNPPLQPIPQSIPKIN